MYLRQVKIQMMYRLLFFAAVFISTVSCAQTQEKTGSSQQPINAGQDSMLLEQKNQLAREYGQKKIEYFIINVPNDQFGYYIMIDGQMYIEQKTIPAIEGNQGFKTREDAEKIAKLVIQKIRSGEIPPDVTVEELKSNNVIENCSDIL